MLWRTFESPHAYGLCMPMLLPEGLLVSHDYAQPAQHVRQAIYHHDCHGGATPRMNTNTNLITNMFAEDLPIVAKSWQVYTLNDFSGGSFLFSVAPAICSLAALAVITWFLTIFVLTSYMIKASLLLNTSVVAASAYMLVVVIHSIVILHRQQRQGYLQAEVLLEIINSRIYLKVIDLVVTFCLQINQVQLIMRLFSRHSDKRLVFLVGLVASIASQTLWSVSKFLYFNDTVEAGNVIPAVTYLIRISMSISYAAIFTAFLITKLKTLHPTIWALSVLSLVLIYSPVAFFVSDVSNAWTYDLSEIFSVVTYVMCVVIPWEWCNQYNILRTIQEKEGVLGRKFYEDEVYELDKYGLFVEEEDQDSGQDVTHARSGLSHRSLNSFNTRWSRGSKEPNKIPPVTESSPGVKDTLAHGYVLLRDGFLQVADFIIATGMAIPRSVSAHSRPVVGGPAPHLHHHMDSPTRENERRHINGDVYVYCRRDMRITFDE